MANPLKFQVLQGIDARQGAMSCSPRALYESRRGMVLSYEQLVSGPGLLRRVARPLAVMPARAARVEAAPRISAADLARDPLAHPVYPARPQGAAKLVHEVVTEEIETKSFGALAVQPDSVAVKLDGLLVEPASEPRHRGSLHGGLEHPVRSMLSPSQRAALRRPETRLDRNRESTYITYTVNTGESR